MRCEFISSLTLTQRRVASIIASTNDWSAMEYSAIRISEGYSAGFVGQAACLPVAGSMPLGIR